MPNTQEALGLALAVHRGVGYTPIILALGVKENTTIVGASRNERTQ